VFELLATQWRQAGPHVRLLSNQSFISIDAVWSIRSFTRYSYVFFVTHSSSEPV
jgi:hypothetical protein